MNLYIESIEGGNYVVETGDGDSRKTVMKSDGKPKTFHCLTEVRTYFENTDFDKVWLRQITPYEEMVGSTSDNGPLEIELEW